jgi:biopolymer transport protein ExbD
VTQRLRASLHRKWPVWRRHFDRQVNALNVDFWAGYCPVDRTTLQSYISHEAAKNPQPEVHVAVDKFSKYEIVAQPLADLQHRGLKKIGFVNNDFF